MYDIIVIGAGPAGMTAAIYACRYGMKVLVLEKEGVGGQIASSPKVENYPGVLSASGAEISDKMFSQMTGLGAETEFEEVSAIEYENEVFSVKTGGPDYQARAVVVCAGVRHRALDAAGVESVEGGGISYCAVCDGSFYAGKTVCVVGGGDSAVQDALLLSEMCEKVYIIHRRDEFRAEPALVGRADARGNIEKVMDSEITRVLTKEGSVCGVNVRNKKTGDDRQLDCDGIFVAIGLEAVNDAYKGLAKMTGDGYFDSGEACTTETPGIFVAGDCRAKAVRQLTTAVADGAVAALAACRYAAKFKKDR